MYSNNIESPAFWIYNVFSVKKICSNYIKIIENFINFL